MIFYFNNCRGSNYPKLFGPKAFYDLDSEGPQAKMATGLEPGQECVVASFDDTGKVLFNWYIFEKETIDPDPREEKKFKVRVFRGRFLKSESMSKVRAAKTKRYSNFFNVNGHFKRRAVLKR